MSFVEGVEVIDRGVTPVSLYVFDGVQCRALRQEVIGGPSILLFVGGPGGQRIGSSFVSRHQIKS